jgi:taurine dioxygenase
MVHRIPLAQLHPSCVAHHGVVCIDGGAPLSPTEFLDVARLLGRPEAFGLPKYRPDGFPPEVTLIDTHGDGMAAAPRGFGEGWHQDSTYLPKPPEFTVLHALDVPPSGGETLFADTRPALAAISSDDRGALKVLTLEHAVRGSYRISERDVGRSVQDLLSGLPKALHPVVFRHPRVRETLLLSPLYTLDGLKPEVRPLFHRVLREVLKGQIAHRWRAGQLLAWDNRVVLHAASPYHGEERRRLIRTVVRDVGE